MYTVSVLIKTLMFLNGTSRHSQPFIGWPSGVGMETQNEAC